VQRAGAFVVAAVILTATTRVHAGDVRQECVNAAERAQQLRDDRSFVAASTMAITCARPECPAVLQRDCAELVSDLRARTPSLIVRVRTRGRDRFDAAVTLDGKPIEITGAAIPVDPGRHVLRAQVPGGRPTEQTLLAAEREQARMIDLSIDDEPASTPPPVVPAAAKPAVAPAPPAEGAAKPGSRGIPAAAWVTGGIGIVGVAGFIYFGLKAHSDIDYLKSTCAPACSDEQISYANAKRIAADVSLGVGILGLGLATVFILTAPKNEVRVGYSPAIGGGLATLSGAL
jgi:hypothetical protein